MDAELTAQCAYIFKRLNSSGVKDVAVSFSGSGDDGNLEITNWNPYPQENSFEEGTPFTRDGSDVNLTFCELIEYASEHILNLYDVDYCNNEGNEGYICFNAELGKIETNYRTYGEVTEDLYI